MAKYEFQTEVNQLLKLIIHSLYSNKDIFLREIVSNGSDALDKLKYLTVSDEAFKNIKFEPRIDITFDEKESTLTVQDSGIGMTDEDLTNNLGTIARSGTKAFMEQLTAEASKDSALIGQFGVGFYSAFMAAKKIDVYTRKAAGDGKIWHWSSDGTNSYEIEEVAAEVLGLNKLPASGKNCIRFNDSGDIVSNSAGSTKSADFKINDYYVTQKYTNEEGGAQDNQRNDVIDFLKKGSLKHKVAALVDGSYWDKHISDLYTEFKNNPNVWITSVTEITENKNI